MKTANLLEQIAALTAERDSLASWITDRAWTSGGDWACAQCHPGSHILEPGFVCGFHQAEAIKLAASLKRNPLVVSDSTGRPYLTGSIVVTQDAEVLFELPYVNGNERKSQLVIARKWATDLFNTGRGSTVKDNSAQPR